MRSAPWSIAFVAMLAIAGLFQMQAMATRSRVRYRAEQVSSAQQPSAEAVSRIRVGEDMAELRERLGTPDLTMAQYHWYRGRSGDAAKEARPPSAGQDWWAYKQRDGQVLLIAFQDGHVFKADKVAAGSALP